MFINENPGIDLKMLCKVADLTKQNIIFHLNILEESGLIEKLKVLDVKGVKFHPTKKGKDVYLQAKLDLLIKSSI